MSTPIKAVVSNSAAGIAHPEDPSLRIPQVTVVDSSGVPASSGGSRVFTYDDSGNVVTITWTINGNVYVKTFTWANGVLTNISEWVKQ